MPPALPELHDISRTVLFALTYFPRLFIFTVPSTTIMRLSAKSRNEVTQSSFSGLRMSPCRGVH